ncbi:HAD family hydrolase [Microlunatus sp. GCM10028923]|uniref:HAD family hydrolase n=1 Tax=Microlunatus sp. GCM10028923 TaxID=3273400 RepID=UPI003619DB88
MTTTHPDKTVLLVDVGGVLLLLNREALVPVIAEYGGVTSAEDFYRAHCAAHNAAHPTRGEPLGGYYDLLPRYAGVPESRWADCTRAYFAASCVKNMWHDPDQQSKAALAGFVDAGIAVAIVSQADGHIAEMLWDAKMCQEGEGPGVTVDRVFDSTVIGLNKPDPQFFLHAVKEVGGLPDRAVHVGDTVPADVVGAQAAEILAVHYDPYDDCDAPDDHEHVRTLIEMSRYLALPA